MIEFRIFSLNVEKGKFITKHLDVLKNAHADVYCFQEIVEPHMMIYEKELGLHSVFAPVTRVEYDHLPPDMLPVCEGIGIVSRHPIREWAIHVVTGENGPVPDFVRFDLATRYYKLLVVTIEIEGEQVTIATVHLPKAPNGDLVTEMQHDALNAMLAHLEKYEHIVLAGDINAPRGGEIFGAIATKYTDCIPSHYKTSLDLNHHLQAKNDGERMSRLVVDGLFVTDHYEPVDVKYITDVSDHFAVDATLRKK